MDKLIQEIEKREKQLLENEKKNEEKLEFINKTIENLKIPSSVYDVCSIIANNETPDFFNLKITDCILLDLVLKFPEANLESLKKLIVPLEPMNEHQGVVYVQAIEEMNDTIRNMLEVLNIAVKETNEAEFTSLLSKLIIAKKDLNEEELKKFNEYIELLASILKQKNIEKDKITDVVDLLHFLIDIKKEDISKKIRGQERLKDFFPSIHKLIPDEQGKTIFIGLQNAIGDHDCQALLLSAYSLKQIQDSYALSQDVGDLLSPICEIYSLLEDHGYYGLINSYIHKVEQLKKKKIDKKKNYIIELKNALENLPKDKYISYTERLNNILYDDELKYEYLSLILKLNEEEYTKIKNEKDTLSTKAKIDKLLEKNKISIELLSENTKKILYTKNIEDLKKLLSILSQPEFSFIDQRLEEFEELFLTLNPKTLSSISNLIKQKYISSVFVSRNLEVLLKNNEYNKEINKILKRGMFETVNENIKILKEKIPNITSIKSRNPNLLLMNKDRLQENLNYLDKYPINLQELTIFDCIEDPTLFSIADFLIEENKSYILERNPNILIRRNKYLKEKILLLKQLNIPYETKEKDLLPNILQEDFQIRGIKIPDQEIENYLIEDIKKIKQKKK